jgi:hypothetical protein
MKNQILVLNFIVLSLFWSSHVWTTFLESEVEHTDLLMQSSCDILEFYHAAAPQNGTKIITQFGNVEVAEMILTPTNIDPGLYDVHVTRKADNLYQIDGTNLIVETNFCFQFAIFQEAVLRVQNNFGFIKGKLIFE